MPFPSANPGGEECAGSQATNWALTLLYQGLPGGAPRWQDSSAVGADRRAP